MIDLEKESKSLKREENEYLTLKQENASLLSEIAFLRSKQQEKTGMDGEELNKIMLLLNIFPFNSP